jgi:hypothetical protein
LKVAEEQSSETNPETIQPFSRELRWSEKHQINTFLLAEGAEAAEGYSYPFLSTSSKRVSENAPPTKLKP